MFVVEYHEKPRRGPAPIGAQPKTKQQFRREYKLKKRAEAIEHIAVLDMETEPFDNTTAPENVKPFLAVLYSDNFDPIIIWEEDHEQLYNRIITSIEALPGSYTVYAHNGGKFDYMLFVHKLRGAVKFKGRGIMCARIGNHELRDSYHILPEPLRNMRKDDFDISKCKRDRREKFREDIIRYCTNDCAYLLDFVKSFVTSYGFVLSIGQAAVSLNRKNYTVKRIGEQRDEHLRQYFFGGRVECIGGKGHWHGDYKLYDVNSMYPAVMCDFQHPIGNEYAPRTIGGPTDYTAFVRLRCRNYGALVCRLETGETTAEVAEGIFTTTIHEYNTALELGLIDNIEILEWIDCENFSDFKKTILPLYNQRQAINAEILELERLNRKWSPTWLDLKKQSLFLKLLMNNLYGKFSQNPRKYKDTFITAFGERPPLDLENPWGELPRYESPDHAVWERPSKPWRFYNVGTSASITGAARAVLLRAKEHAIDPLYCDTDSIICRELLHTDLDPLRLGAWKLEQEFSEVLIAGKKLYACRDKHLTSGAKGAIKVRSKGVNLWRPDVIDSEAARYAEQERVWATVQKILVDEAVETVKAHGVTLMRSGTAYYGERRIRSTAPRRAFPITSANLKRQAYV